MGKARGPCFMNGVWHSPRACLMLLNHFTHFYLGLDPSGPLTSLLGFKFSSNPQRTVFYSLPEVDRGNFHNETEMDVLCLRKKCILAASKSQLQAEAQRRGGANKCSSPVFGGESVFQAPLGGVFHLQGGAVLGSRVPDRLEEPPTPKAPCP